MKQMTEIAIEVAELRAENKLLKSVNDSLIQALHKPVVVRGGDFENQFVRHVEKYFKYPDLTKTPNTPTEPLATEARVIIEECKKRTTADVLESANFRMKMRGSPLRSNRDCGGGQWRTMNKAMCP
ncbi:MAG: hypothetical protein ACK53T_01185 [Planctomycetota bacterium]